MWTPWFIAAFATGLVAVVICCFSFLFPSRKITLLFRLAFDFVGVLNGICIYFSSNDPGIWAIVATDAISLVRDIVYLGRDKFKWSNSKFWLVFFEALYICSVPFIWSGPISLLPAAGSLLNNFGYYLKDVKKTKILCAIGQIFFIIYNSILIPSTGLLTILTLLCSTAFFLSAIIGLIILKKKSKKGDLIS